MDNSVSFGNLRIIITCGAILSILLGICFVFARLKVKNQGFGPNSLKALGIVFLLPTLLMIAVHGRFQAETLAALLGTIAGFVLSRSKDED